MDLAGRWAGSRPWSAARHKKPISSAGLEVNPHAPIRRLGLDPRPKAQQGELGWARPALPDSARGCHTSRG